MSHVIRCLLIVSLVVGVSGCRNYTLRDTGRSIEEKTFIDRDTGMTAEDYNKALAPRPIPAKGARGAAPDLAPVVAEDQRDILPQPLVSVTVNQDVPIRDIFYELAKQAQVDLELDPDITGSVIFTAYNRPFDQVVDRLSSIAGLRYTYENNVLKVERDLPFMKVYHVDHLGMTRKFESEIKANTGVDASAIGASGGSGGQNGSKSVISTNSDSDFWKEIQSNLSQILEVGRYEQRQNQKTAVPLTTPNAIPAVTTEQLAGGAPAAPAQPAAPTPTAPVAEKEEKLGEGGGGGLGDPYFTVNKQAGLINVFASDRQHKQVASYLRAVHTATNSQVLIEAKVVEVFLSNEYAMGINWNEAFIGDAILRASLTNQNFLTGTQATGQQLFTLGLRGDDVGSVLLSALSRFGTTRTLSSPRLTVMNNQSAVLNVSENKVFFDLDVTIQQGSLGVPSTTTVNSQVKSVPEGIIINVYPSIDLATNEVTMNLRPSITKMVDQVEDPGVAYVTQLNNITGLSNKIPVIAVREMDSVVKMKSGETIVMGGLMQNAGQASQVGVPVLGEIPGIGALFRSQSDSNRKTELVILLKSTVVTPKPDKTDQEVYEAFGKDRHPFNVR